MPTTPAVNNNKLLSFSLKEQVHCVAVIDTYNLSLLSTINGNTTNVNYSSEKTREYINSKKWSTLKNKITLYKAEGLFNKINLYGTEQRLTKILKEIYSLNPFAVSVQLTSDESILISFKVDSLISYLEYFPENSFHGIPEYVLNTYQNKMVIIDSYSGTLPNIFEKLKSSSFHINKIEDENLSNLIENGIVIGELNYSSNFDEIYM